MLRNQFGVLETLKSHLQFTANKYEYRESAYAYVGLGRTEMVAMVVAVAYARTTHYFTFVAFP